MQRREMLGGMAAMLSWALGACKGRRSQPPSSPLRVSVSLQLSMSPLYLTQELGYFAEAGAPVEFVPIALPSQTVPLLAGGKLDAAFLILSPAFVNPAVRGGQLKIVAGRHILSATCQTGDTVYGNRQVFPQGLNNVRQLKGRKISIAQKASVIEFFVETLLASGGMTTADVQLLVMPRAEAVAALIGGKIDAMMDHFVERDVTSVSSQVVRGIPISRVLPEFQFAHIIFGKRLLEADPALGVQFLSAYLRGAREFLRGKTPKFMEDFARANGLDPQRVREACRDTFTPDGSIRLEDVQRFLDWTVKKGYCEPPLKTAQLVDTRFLGAAQKMAGLQT